MLAMDIPLSAMCGLVFAEAGKNMIESGEKQKTTFVRVVVLAYAALCVTPNVFYYMLGWPAWETNFVWPGVDNIQDSALLAGISHLLFAMTVIPAWLGFELGRVLVLKKKYRLVRILYIILFICVLLIVVALRDITFNVASTYAKYEAKEFYPFMTWPMMIGWAITTSYFWGTLIGTYLWLRKKS